jgi:protein TonB
MYANGFLEQKKRSPVSLAAVVGLHAAALGAAILYGTTTFLPPDRSGIRIITIRPEPPVPPPDPPPPQPRQNLPEQHQSVIDQRPPDAAPVGPQMPANPPTPPQPPAGQPGPVHYAEAATPSIPDPVRIGAEVDPRFRDALQPPYPREQEAAQRGGQVRVRITIGTDGRVSAITQLFATNDSFWRVTERQARNRWRFRPATVDGRPIVSTMVMTVTFRIPDA